ncbi:MAG: hypothetical protein V3U73_04250 [bacterium]
MKRALTFFVLLATFLPATALSQPARSSRFEIGAMAGVFRISMDKFNDFYESRVAYPVGGSLDYAFTPSLHLSVRGKTFTKSVTFFDDQLGRNVDFEWQQSWIGIGVQRLSSSFSGKSRTFFGFGLVFFIIEQNEEGFLLDDLRIDSKTTNPKGFFLNIGFDRYVARNMSIRFEIEATSASVGEGFGVESQSFGGIFVGLGFNLNLF